MSAADTSTWVAFLEGDAGHDAQLLDKALAGLLILLHWGYWSGQSLN